MSALAWFAAGYLLGCVTIIVLAAVLVRNEE